MENTIIVGQDGALFSRKGDFGSLVIDEFVRSSTSLRGQPKLAHHLFHSSHCPNTEYFGSDRCHRHQGIEIIGSGLDFGH